MNTGAQIPSIRHRVTKTLLGISLIWGVLVAAVVWGVVRHEIDELMDQGLRESGETIYSVLEPAWHTAQKAPQPQQHSAYEEHLIWQIIEVSTGQVVHRSHKAPTTALQTQPQRDLTRSADGQWRVMTMALEHDSTHFLLIAQSEWERGESRTEAVLLTLLGALLMGAFATLMLSLLIRKELQPLSDLSNAVQTHDPLQPGTALPAPQRAELAPMVLAIQGLGQRLAQRVMSERAFSAHAAHAMRTPLAGIDTQLAVAIREAPPTLQPRLMRTRDATRRLSHVMRALLTMFRSGTEPKPQQVSIGTLLSPWSFDRLAIETDGSEVVNADPDLLGAVLLNLLDNACQHHATRIHITRSRSAQGLQTLRLHDDGQGCPPERLQHLRKALQTHDHHPETGLKGLGLILSDLVMQAHGGHVTLADVTQGFCVELQWPDLPSRQ
ncbi:MAG: hypothetical protein RI959_192 [Pseudomonadota bacterium]